MENGANLMILLLPLGVLHSHCCFEILLRHLGLYYICINIYIYIHAA